MSCCCGGSDKVEPETTGDGKPSSLEDQSTGTSPPAEKLAPVDPKTEELMTIEGGLISTVIGHGRKHRVCTDCLCCLLLLGSWVAMTAIGLIVTGAIESPHLEAGDPAVLLHGVDYEGNLCGTDSKVNDKPYIYYLPFGGGVCVEDCPKETTFEDFICTYDNQAAADANINTAYQLTSEFECMYEAATKTIGFYCVYSAILDASSSYSTVGVPQNVTDILYGENTDSTQFEQAFSDIATMWWQILVFGFVLALVGAFILIRVLRLPCVLDLLVWGILLGIMGTLLYSGYNLRYKVAKDWQDEEKPRSHSDSSIRGARILGLVFLILGVLWACFICFIRKRIFLAIGITKESARAMGRMTALALFPLLQCLATGAFTAVTAVFLLYLASSGEEVKQTKSYGFGDIEYTTYEYSRNTQRAGWYLLFCWFWTTQFIVAIGQLVVALSVSKFYFTRDKSKCGSGTVVAALRTTLRFHTGTAAFGSLIIAIVKLARAFLTYVQKKLKKVPKKFKLIAKIVLCCMQCALWCLEKCLKMLSKHAYIQTAMFSYSFCKAARKAFFLILRNLLKIAAVALVAYLIIGIILIFVPLFCVFVALFYFQGLPDDKIYSIYGPLFAVLILSYITAKMFNGILSMVISTMLQCYIMDTEFFPNEADRFAPGSLKSTIFSTHRKSVSLKVAPEEARKGEKTDVEFLQPQEDPGTNASK